MTRPTPNPWGDPGEWLLVIALLFLAVALAHFGWRLAVSLLT